MLCCIHKVSPNDIYRVSTDTYIRPYLVESLLRKKTGVKEMNIKQFYLGMMIGRKLIRR